MIDLVRAVQAGLYPNFQEIAAALPRYFEAANHLGAICWLHGATLCSYSMGSPKPST